MSVNVIHSDVVVVGASVAGTAAAILYAQKGLSVSIIERQTDMQAYKKTCTHVLEASATPILRKLGVIDAIEAAGGVRNGGRVWTRYGWVGGRSQKIYGYSVRRETLDPIMRQAAADQENVDLYLGTSVRSLIEENGRVVGLRAVNRQREQIEFRARLVVGADGRYSKTAELAQLGKIERENNRAFFFAYFRNLRLARGLESQMWLLEPNIAYAMPNDDDVTLLAVAVERSRIKTFKSDLQNNFMKSFENLSLKPDMSDAEQISPVMGMVNAPNTLRNPAGRGVTLVGDALMALDPVWGTGVAHAVKSANWLVQKTARLIRNGDEFTIDQGLFEYMLQHKKATWRSFITKSQFAKAGRLNLIERIFYAAATRDRKYNRYVGPYSLEKADRWTLPEWRIVFEAAMLNVSHLFRDMANNGLPQVGINSPVLASSVN